MPQYLMKLGPPKMHAGNLVLSQLDSSSRITLISGRHSTGFDPVNNTLGISHGPRFAPTSLKSLKSLKDMAED